MKETNIHSKTIINKAWNSAAGRFDHSFVFAFQTKPNYLEFRRCWKTSYATLSQSIRGLKASVKTIMRQREYAGKQQSELHVRKAEATVELLMLKAAKLEAARQYAAARMIANSLKLTTIAGQHIHTITGSSTNGIAEVHWDLLYDGGKRYTDESFNSTWTV